MGIFWVRAVACRSQGVDAPDRQRRRVREFTPGGEGGVGTRECRVSHSVCKSDGSRRGSVPAEEPLCSGQQRLAWCRVDMRAWGVVDAPHHGPGGGGRPMKNITTTGFKPFLRNDEYPG